MTTFPILASAQELSDRSVISLMTVAPGSELYSTFGHSAIRVWDPEIDIDKVYNYGVFDFKTPNFYGKFVRGKLNYQLDVSPGYLFIKFYKLKNRSIFQKNLFLTLSEKRKLYEFLENNYLPENRFYQYDFFYENCATKIRDAFENVLGQDLVLSPSKEQKTFRELLDEYIAHKLPWSDFGIDLALGAVIDVNAPQRDKMFLPDYLAEGFENGTVLRNGKKVPLVMSNHTLFKSTPSDISAGISPTLILWIVSLMFIFLTVFQHSKNIDFIGLDFVFLLCVGIPGIILILLWFATDHTATAINLNVLWLNPLFVVTAFLLFVKRQRRLLSRFFFITMILNACLITFSSFLPQVYHSAFIPLMAMIAVRSHYLSKWTAKEVKS